MLDYAHFRLLGRLGDVPTPFYIGHGVAISPAYHSNVITQPPMPAHVLVKVALSQGGAVWPDGPDAEPLPLVPGQATLTYVEDDRVAEGYHPEHRGDYEYVGLILTGRPAVSVAAEIMRGYGRVFDVGTDAPFTRHLLRLAKQADHAIVMTAAEGMRLVNDALHAVLTAGERAADLAGRQVASLPQSVARTIQGDLARDWTVKELADLHEVSREHLTRVFSGAMGISPHKYVVEERIREACRRLRDTDEPIKTIMLELGFKSSASFVRAFRRIHAVSPSQYREGQTGAGF